MELVPGNDDVRVTNPGVKLTYDDFLLFPDDGKRHELIDGEHYVTPSPDLQAPEGLRQSASADPDVARGAPDRPGVLRAIRRGLFEVRRRRARSLYMSNERAAGS